MTFRQKWDSVIDVWMKRVVAEQAKHERLAIAAKRWHFGVGILAISLASLTSGSVFVEMANNSPTLKGFIGTAAIAVAALTGVQTFMQFAAASERHRIANARCKALVRELEINKTYPPQSRDEADMRMRRIHELFSDFEKDALLTMASLREHPKEESLKTDLEGIASSSETVTNLGFRMWSHAETIPDEDETP